MKHLFIVMSCVGFLLYSFNVFSSEQNFVNGAGTLPGGDWALSLDVGVSLPEPLGVGVRADWGIGDRVQLGLSASTLIVVNTVSINALFNILKTQNDSDFFSIYLTPTFAQSLSMFWTEEDVNIKSVEMFFLQPGLAYEHRFGNDRNTGLFIKAGTINFLASTSDGKFKLAGLSSNNTGIQAGLGVQHNFGGSFSLSVEGYAVTPINPSASKKVSGMGKVGLTWVF